MEHIESVCNYKRAKQRHILHTISSVGHWFFFRVCNNNNKGQLIFQKVSSNISFLNYFFLSVILADFWENNNSKITKIIKKIEEIGETE